MSRKSIKVFVFTLFLFFILLCGTVFAYMYHRTNLLGNELVPASVSCLVHEKIDGTGDYTSGAYSADTKTSIKVENTGNIDCYIRVRFVSYWTNSKGEIMPKASQLPTIQVQNGWTAASDGTYYYDNSVKPDGFTSELLASPIILQISEEGYLQVVEVFAEAIQSNPESAAIQSWQ